MAARRSSEQARPSMICPWEGPLPAPRASPKLSIGDIIEKPKVRYETNRACLAYRMAKAAVAKPTVVHRKSSIQRSPERKGY
jgi:hypothetical protein